MDRSSADIDRQLGEWLREEATARAPEGLVEAVFARTSRTGQARRWWPPVVPFSRDSRPHLVEAGRTSRRWSGLPLAGAVGFVVVIAVLAISLRPSAPGPGGPTASPSVTPAVSASPTQSVEPTLRAPLPSPRATTLDGSAAKVLHLGADAGPIDVVEAFDSIWTANIHSNDVSRLDPITLEETARIPAGTGPAWFAATSDALWVTNQTGQGLVRIDPVTNTAVAAVGEAQPCGAPVLAFQSLWASACDSNVTLRIDPSTNELLSTIPTAGYRWLALVDGRLITGSAATLAEIDPATNTLTDLQICCGDILGSDGQTLWLDRVTDVARMDPADGRIVATFPYSGAGAVTFADGRAWLTTAASGLLEIDLASNAVLRTLPISGFTLVAREAAGALWVTAFDTSDLWRIEP